VTLPPHDYWQWLEPAGSAETTGPFTTFFPATLPDGRVLRLPIRVLPGDGDAAVASLIANQASFLVLDALAEAMTNLVASAAPDVIVGVPTLGLPLAEGVARRLGHERLVALSTSRKFWYEEAFSEPISSITSPTHAKRLFLDPRLLPLLSGKRVAVIDDVVSSGRSLVATLRLLRRAEVEPVAVAVAMLQGGRWREALADADAGWPALVRGVIASPLLEKSGDGWVAT
jgi:adenine/guanine phosphoribosyltransferase-like PRPP-binding protein